jgi:hypothetical protein
MGSIIGALIGRHLHHTEQAREVDRHMTLTPIDDYLKNGAESGYSPDQVRAAIKHGVKAGTISKNLAITAEAHVAQTEPAWEAKQGQKLLESQQKTLHDAQQPKGMGGTSTPSAFNPGPSGGDQFQLNDDHKQQLMPMVMDAMRQQQGTGPYAPTGERDTGGAPINRLPAPPSEAGGPAGAAPAPQPNPAAAMTAGSVNGGMGFGPPITPAPPVATAAPKPFWERDRTPTQIGQAQGERLAATQAATLRPELETRALVGREQGALDYEAMKARYTSEPWFKGLTDRQKAEVLSKVNISAEPRPQNIPGLARGSDIIGEKDIYGKVIGPDDAGGSYKVRVFADGTREYIPEFGVTSGTIEPDAKSPTGFSKVFRNREGTEISRSLSATPPAPYVPTTTTNNRQSEQALTVGNEVRIVPTSSSTSTTTTRQVPGMPAPPAGSAPAGAPPAGAPARPAAAATPAPRQGRVIGESPAAWKARIENEYTPNGQKVMAELYPRMEMIKRLIGYLEPNKNDDTPASHLLDTLAYRMGFAGNTGGFLSQLQLGSIGQAGSLIKGVSRAKEVLDKAMIHTPAAWKDSNKMMFQKLTEIYRNMQDMEAGVNKFEKKYPGLGAPPPGGIAPPPGSAGAESEAQKIERLARKHM